MPAKKILLLLYLIATCAVAQDTESVDLELLEYIADFEKSDSESDWVDPQSVLDLEELAARLNEEPEK